MKIRITLMRDDGTVINYDETALPEIAKQMLDRTIEEFNNSHCDRCGKVSDRLIKDEGQYCAPCHEHLIQHTI